MSSRIAYLALGSNLGDRAELLRDALRSVRADPDMDVVAVSPIYESAAQTVDGVEQPPYLNAAVSVSTVLPARVLLTRCLAIEARHGRVRSANTRWAARTLDVDVLCMEMETIQTPELQIPHPRLAERRFVLQPLSDLAPDLYLPEPYDSTVAQLLAVCPDPNPAHRSTIRLDVPQPLPPQAELWPEPDVRPIEPVDTLPDSLQYVVIEGVIGAGKTTLARMLAERFAARLVLEQFEENPFLERFYGDRPRWAFQTQLSFLASRFRQQQALARGDLFQQTTVSDYAFDKDRIFARINLSGDELGLYDTMFNIMQPSVPRPDLIVYLQSTTDRLMDQIRRRGRSYEASMDPEYIASLNEAYNQYFFHFNAAPLLIVNATRLDFVQNSADLEELVVQIARIKHLGTTYFNPTRPASVFP